MINAVGMGAWTVEKCRNRGRPKLRGLPEDKPLFYEFNRSFATAANSRDSVNPCHIPDGDIRYFGSGFWRLRTCVRRQGDHTIVSAKWLEKVVNHE